MCLQMSLKATRFFKQPEKQTWPRLRRPSLWRSSTSNTLTLMIRRWWDQHMFCSLSSSLFLSAVGSSFSQYLLICGCVCVCVSTALWRHLTPNGNRSQSCCWGKVPTSMRRTRSECSFQIFVLFVNTKRWFQTHHEADFISEVKISSCFFWCE